MDLSDCVRLRFRQLENPRRKNPHSHDRWRHLRHQHRAPKERLGLPLSVVRAKICCRPCEVKVILSDSQMNISCEVKSYWDSQTKHISIIQTYIFSRWLNLCPRTQHGSAWGVQAESRGENAESRAGAAHRWVCFYWGVWSPKAGFP